MRLSARGEMFVSVVDMLARAAAVVVWEGTRGVLSRFGWSRPEYPWQCRVFGHAQRHDLLFDPEEFGQYWVTRCKRRGCYWQE